MLCAAAGSVSTAEAVLDPETFHQQFYNRKRLLNPAKWGGTCGCFMTVQLCKDEKGKNEIRCFSKINCQSGEQDLK